MTTTLMLRAIADTARHQGEDLRLRTCGQECFEVQKAFRSAVPEVSRAEGSSAKLPRRREG